MLEIALLLNRVIRNELVQAAHLIVIKFFLFTEILKNDLM